MQKDSKEPDKPDTPEPKPQRTWGGFIHKWGTYLSVDWVYNATVGVGFAYVTKYTELGRKMWSGPITSGFEKALKPLIKDPHQLKKSAGYGNMFMSIIAGGMMTIPPLLILESKHVKKSITQFFDRMIYGADKVENDPKFQDAYQAIDDAPKKDSIAGNVSRFIALAPLLAMVLAHPTKKMLDRGLFKPIEKATNKAARALGFSEKSFHKLPTAEAKERWKFIHESAAMDLGFGLPYAIMHSFWYGQCAKWFNGRKTAEIDSLHVVDVADTETPPAAAPHVEPSHKSEHARKELQRRQDVSTPLSMSV